MAKKKVVKYVDFGIRSAKQFWVEIVTPVYEKFKAEPNGANAITASILAWQILDWIWHDEHPGENTLNNPDYYTFKNKLLTGLPELAWIRDVAEAGKHRGLGRGDIIQGMASQAHFIHSFIRAGGPKGVRMWTTPLTITLADGSTREFAEVLSNVIDHWRQKYFP